MKTLLEQFPDVPEATLLAIRAALAEKPLALNWADAFAQPIGRLHTLTPHIIGKLDIPVEHLKGILDGSLDPMTLPPSDARTNLVIAQLFIAVLIELERVTARATDLDLRLVHELVLRHVRLNKT